MSAARPRLRIFFSYAVPLGFSGQRAATETVMAGLAQRGWECRALPLPVFRDEGRPGRPFHFALAVAMAWFRSLQLLGSPGSWLCVNLGQTRFALLRDALPLLVGRLGLGRRKVIVALHGSLFMRWDKRSIDCRIFCFLLRHTGTVVALGEAQRRRLIGLGKRAEEVEVFVNTCDLEPLTPGAVVTKHDTGAGARPLRALFLSSLIDAKGYPEFLQAARQLGAEPGPEFQAILCGNVAASPYAESRREPAAAAAWIESQIEAINREPRCRASWIHGAVGEEKAHLFREADLFVLPTRYQVEAQPLVLLEAMASGCAIITTSAGEIPTILDQETAIVLNAVTAETVVEAWRALALDPSRRRRLAVAAHRRYSERYTLERHLAQWLRVLGAAGSDSGPSS